MQFCSFVSAFPLILWMFGQLKANWRLELEWELELEVMVVREIENRNKKSGYEVESGLGSQC